MRKQYRIVSGYRNMTKNEAKDFKKLDTIVYGECVELKVFDNLENAKAELKKYKSYYGMYNDYICVAEEYAIEEYTVDDNGEFYSGSDYYPADETTDSGNYDE